MYEYLAQRCAAEPPSADLDAEIVRAVFGAAGAVRPVTSSIDCAVTLAPDGFRWSVTDTGSAFVHWPTPSSRCEYVTGASPALALCQAAMQARAAVGAKVAS